MIRREQAERQALRFIVVPGMNVLNTANNEITEALERGSRNVEHADRIVTEALKTFSAAGIPPTPSEILRLANHTDPEFDPREWRCSECGGTGWKDICLLVTWAAPNRKSVQVISSEQYEQLRSRVSGVLGEQLVRKAVEHCRCPIGLRRVEAIAADELEEGAKASAKSSSREKRQRTM